MPTNKLQQSSTLLQSRGGTMSRGRGCTSTLLQLQRSTKCQSSGLDLQVDSSTVSMYPPTQWAITTNVVCTSLSLTIYFQSLNDRLIKPGPLFRISCLLPRNVGKWSPAATTVDEIFTPYDADIPEHLQQVRESECMRWKSRWEKANDLPGTLHDTLEQCSPHEFPNIAKAFTVLLTLPITTATAERSFSALGRLKTYMRSTMKEERLNGLALMHIHKHDIQIDTEEIINEFAAASPRRLELLF